MTTAIERPLIRLSYSPEEAAEVTSLSRAEIDRAIASGELKAKKRGRRVVVPHEALRVFLDALPDYER